MMSVKISSLALVLMAGATSLFADNKDKGIDYYKAGMYSYAKKALFENKELEKELNEAGYQFSSANSINIGRLVPQVVY